MEGEIIDPKSVFPLGLSITYEHRARTRPIRRIRTIHLVEIRHKIRKMDGELTALLTWEANCTHPGCGNTFDVITGSAPLDLQKRVPAYCPEHSEGQKGYNPYQGRHFPSPPKEEEIEGANEERGECEAAQEPNPE